MIVNLASLLLFLFRAAAKVEIGGDRFKAESMGYSGSKFHISCELVVIVGSAKIASLPALLFPLHMNHLKGILCVCVCLYGAWKLLPSSLLIRYRRLRCGFHTGDRANMNKYGNLFQRKSLISGIFGKPDARYTRIIAIAKIVRTHDIIRAWTVVCKQKDAIDQISTGVGVGCSIYFPVCSTATSGCQTAQIHRLAIQVNFLWVQCNIGLRQLRAKGLLQLSLSTNRVIKASQMNAIGNHLI